MVKVVLVYDDITVREYSVQSEELLIGRAPQASILLDDATVSVKHALLESEITREHGQRYYIRDLASKNGTFLKGKRVFRSLLKHGDEFKIGWSTFRFLEYQPVHS